MLHFPAPKADDLTSKVIGFYVLLCDALDAVDHARKLNASQRRDREVNAHDDDLEQLSNQIRALCKELEQMIDDEHEQRPQGLGMPSRIRTIGREIDVLVERAKALGMKREFRRGQGWSY